MSLRNVENAFLGLRWLVGSVGMSFVILLSMATLLPAPDGSETPWLAFLLCGPVAQDFLRHAALAGQRLRTAVAADGLWLATAPLLIAMGPRSATGILGSWALAGWLSCLLLVRRGACCEIAIRKLARLGAYQSLDFSLAALAMTGPLLVAYQTTSADDVGAYRLAQSLLGPIAVVHMAVVLHYLMRAPRLRGVSSSAVFVRSLRRAGLALSGFTLAYGAVLTSGYQLIMPQHMKLAAAPRLPDALVAVTVTYALTSVASPYIAALRATQAQRAGALARVFLFALVAATTAVCFFTPVRIGGDQIGLPLVMLGVGSLIIWPVAYRRANPTTDGDVGTDDKKPSRPHRRLTTC
jgi:hypothetical protein